MLGDHYNRGKQRKRELWACCEVLGIPRANITLMNNTNMPDDPRSTWHPKQVCKIVLDFIESMTIDEVYTFDVGGVSGHANHVSIFFGFARMCLDNRVPKYCKVYLLDSVNLVRKYCLFCDAGLSCPPFCKNMFMVSFGESATIRKAMQKHSSQRTWYRILYVYFSRYMYINTYRELDLEDVELVIQMDDYNSFF